MLPTGPSAMLDITHAIGVGMEALGRGDPLLVSYRKGGNAMRRIVTVVLIGIAVGFGGVGRVQGASFGSGHIGDALIFPLFDVNNLQTLIAIESFTDRTALHLVRFHDENGTSVLSFELCLTPFSTWTAAIYRDGSITRVVSGSTLPVNGEANPLNTILSGNPTRGFIEVIGLRGTTTDTSDTAICLADSVLAEEVSNSAVMGKAYYVNPAQSSILAYGANALAIKDFAAGKIRDGTVVGNAGVADALILQGTQIAGHESSTMFGSRYFVDPAFGAETQVVMTFATGPTTGGCPSCRIPSRLLFFPVPEDSSLLTTSFIRATSGRRVNVFTMTGGNVSSPSGVLRIVEFELCCRNSIPVTGFVVQTTSTPPPGQPFFSVLFPLTIQ